MKEIMSGANFKKENLYKERQEHISFTGSKDTDLLLLHFCSDETVLNLCRVNKSLLLLCNKQFWMNRCKERHGQVAMEEKKNNICWKKWYFKCNYLLHYIVIYDTFIKVYDYTYVHQGKDGYVHTFYNFKNLNMTFLTWSCVKGDKAGKPISPIYGSYSELSRQWICKPFPLLKISTYIIQSYNIYNSFSK
jgi:hypothetical protein